MGRRVLALGCCALGVWAPLAAGQVLTERTSKLNYNYVYGAGGDTHVGGDDRPRDTLLLADSDNAEYSNSTSGFLPGGQPYGAAVETTISYQYAITGSAQEIGSIAASGTSHVAAVTTGLGSAVMFSSNPGNEIRFAFTVQRSISYRLSGTITLPAASAFSAVALQRFNGFNWEYVFYSAFLPTGQGPFDVSGTLVAGDYRLTSDLGINANANTSGTSSYNYVFDVAGLGGCAADFGGDGFLTFEDFDAFVAAFEAGTTSADFDGDGFLTFEDFDSFVAAFEAGC